MNTITFFGILDDNKESIDNFTPIKLINLAEKIRTATVCFYLVRSFVVLYKRGKA